MVSKLVGILSLQLPVIVIFIVAVAVSSCSCSFQIQLQFPFTSGQFPVAKSLRLEGKLNGATNLRDMHLYMFPSYII
jgi:hypothetical protein